MRKYTPQTHNSPFNAEKWNLSAIFISFSLEPSIRLFCIDRTNSNNSLRIVTFHIIVVNSTFSFNAAKSWKGFLFLNNFAIGWVNNLFNVLIKDWFKGDDKSSNITPHNLPRHFALNIACTLHEYWLYTIRNNSLS